MPVALTQFIDRVADSTLLSREEIAAFLAALPNEKQPADGEGLAKLLVQHEKLTRYQAQQIYAGKGRSLVLGNNVILDQIGAGGMGQVFKAKHRRMNRLVAIKLLPPEISKDETAIQRFQREVQAAAQLMHPNIVTAFDADEAPGGIHFLVMEYVSGSDLAGLIANEPNQPLDRVVHFILQAARGLAYAHENGVIHRDIKPANLLLDEKGTVKILDMGLARFNGGAANVAAQDGLTKSGDVMGTVDYMAPEQAFDTHTVDGRADIYSLGCTLFRLLTGRNLYDGETLVQKLMAHQSQPIPSLRQQRMDVPAELEAVFQRMVAKRVEDRYQTMRDVIEDLEVIADAHSASLSKRNKPDSKLTNFFRGLTGSRSTQAGNDAPTAPIATPLGPREITSNSALEQTVNFSNSGQVTDSVSDDSITNARSQTVTKSAIQSPRSRLLLATGVGGLLLTLLTIWAIKDRSNHEHGRLVGPEGGTSVVVETTVKPVVPPTEKQPASAISKRWPFDPDDGLDYVWSKPENLGPAVNSKFRDLNPALTSDELTMYFQRELKTYVARRESRNVPFTKVELFAESDLAPPDFPEVIVVSITGDGLTMFVSPKVATNPASIWVTERAAAGERFSKLEKLPAPINVGSNVKPFVSADGRTLCISSTRPGRLAGSDVYLFQRKSRNDTFGEGQNLGPTVNVAGMIHPIWISDDTKVLLTTSLVTQPFQPFWHSRESTTDDFSPRQSFGPPFTSAKGPGNVWVSADGQRIYFHSRDLPGGLGELDLWTCCRVPQM